MRLWTVRDAIPICKRYHPAERWDGEQEKGEGMMHKQSAWASIKFKEIHSF